MRLFLYHTNFTIQLWQNLAEVKHNNTYLQCVTTIQKESDKNVLS